MAAGKFGTVRSWREDRLGHYLGNGGEWLNRENGESLSYKDLGWLGVRDDFRHYLVHAA